MPETQAAAENAPNASEAPNGGTDPTNIARSVVGATVNAALRATAAELHKGTPREWFNECAGGQEFASLVNEGNMSPRLRDVVATAAGICDDTGREPDSTADTFLSRASSTAQKESFRERLQRAASAGDIASRVDWSRLVAIETTEALNDQVDAVPDPLHSGKRRPKAVRLDVNSGGQVFVGLLAPEENLNQEEAVVIKFCNSRHMLQSEQMAAELAWHLEISAPTSRLLLRAHDGAEWQELASASRPLCEALGDLLGRKQSMLLMQFIHGSNMQKETGAWDPGRLTASTSALGRLFVLDALLGNADRLPIKSLNWRGNPSNILWSSRASGSNAEGRLCVPIDATVARRPPKMLVQEADQNVDCVLELVLLERITAQQVLLEAVSGNETATVALEKDWAPSESAWAARQPRSGDESAPTPTHGAPATSDHACTAVKSVSAVKAFHEGVRSAVSLAIRELGLLEMVADVIQSWLDAFHVDMGEVSAASACLKSRTKQLQDWSRVANKNDEVKRRMSSWQTLLQEKSIALRQAADDWASRRGVQTVLSFRGFLGNSVLNPIADAYELLVRLQQLIARGKVIANACNVTRPCDLAPTPLLVGPVTACCYHLLQKLGVKCIVNCTADLPPPPQAVSDRGFKWHRLRLEDTEDQDLTSSLEEGIHVIDAEVETGGRVFVHCHEGKSRSVSLCLAYLIMRERRPLADALAFVKSRRPQARPNAGFMRQLLGLELATLGSNSLGPDDLPKGKPKLPSADRRRRGSARESEPD